MTDKRVESMQIDLDELVSLRQQLAERDVVIKDFAQIERGMEEQLAECQAREKVLRDALSIIRERLADDYDLHHNQFSSEFDVIEDALALSSDSTALDSAIKHAMGGH